MKKFNFKFFLLFLFIFLKTNAYAINNYDYPKKNLEPGICEKIYSELNFPQPNYGLEDPTILLTDLYVDRIFEVTPKDSTFKAQVNLWITWKELRLIPILKKYDLFTNKGKPNYLCTFNQNEEFSNFKMFDPAIEFFNRVDRRNTSNEMSDWLDIFSDGTVDQRLKDVGIFSSNFEFKKFPFDKQLLHIEIWSEYPANIVRFKANEPAMTYYATEQRRSAKDEKFFVDGWNIESFSYETWGYLDTTDNKPYEGFYVYLEIDRLTSYYIYKIILPIIFILTISWSVFWIRGSQLEAKVNVTIVCLLSLIAYNFIIDEDIPKLPYLTFMDTFILLSYFYTGIATILCVYSFLRKIKTGKDLSVVDRYAQFIGPISYFGFLIISLIYYYNLEGLGALLKGLLLGPQFN